jgi:hypothetical protein
MGAITWRSLMSDQPHAQASNILGSAQSSFGSAFDALQRVLGQHQSFQAQQAADVQEGIKQAYLDQLAGAKTPEELAALQASGGLSALASRMTNANRGVVRGAEDTRLSGIRQAITAGQEYDSKQRAVAEEPIREMARGLIARKEYKALDQLLGTRDLAKESDLYEASNQAQLADKNRVTQDEKTKLELEALRRNAETQALAATDAAELRKAEALTNEFAARHHQTTGLMRRAVDNEAAQLNVNIANLDKAGREQFNAHLNSKGLPSIEDAMSGDTNAMESAVAALRDAGVKPTHLARIQAQLPAILSTTKATPIGVDAQALAIQKAKEDVLDAAEADRVGVPHTPGNEHDLMQQGSVLIDQLTEKGSMNNASWRRQLAKFLSEGGIKVKGSDGKETRVLPNPKALTTIMNRVNQDWWDAGNDDLDNELQAWAKSPEAKEAAAALLAKQGREALRKVAAAKN